MLGVMTVALQAGTVLEGIERWSVCCVDSYLSKSIVVGIRCTAVGALACNARKRA